MPTRNRRLFVGNAINHFLRQDYPNLELIVLDDGRDTVADVVPTDERIRYHRLEREVSLGVKRNLGCELARGDIIAHFDDDDWMAPRRIRTQVAALSRSGADLCGLAGVVHYRPWSQEAWRYQETEGEAPHVTGGTLVYRRSAWQSHRFPTALPAPTRRFVDSFPSGTIAVLRDASLYVAVLHSANASPKNLSDQRWRPTPTSEVAQTIGADRRFFAWLADSWSPRQSRPAVRDGLTLVAPLMIYDGYGSMAQYLALGLDRAGVAVHLSPLRLDPNGLSPELLELLRRSRPDVRGTVVAFAPGPDVTPFQSSSNLFVNTMWETSQLPAGWSAGVNTARAVIVPSRFVADVFRRGGVTTPIEVVPQGVDPAIYSYQERPLRAGITTLMVGPVCARKNTLLGVEAWKRAFAGDPDARLILKARWLYQNYVSDDPRIRFVDANERTTGIAHWYREADVLLALGNEGFGLPLIEAMATGLPVVALDAEGQADVCREARDLLLTVEPASWQPFDEQPFGPCGVRGVPDVNKVAAHLRWVAGHGMQARALGAAASGWALEHRNVWRMGPAMLDVIERRSRHGRLVRRPRAIWAPRVPRSDGCGRYARHLAAAAPGVAVSEDPPDVGGLRLVHVQHPPGLVFGNKLEELAQQARTCRVPLVLTEHCAGPALDVAELQADALVAPTEVATERLRRRWPARRVEHVPYGCPTWFPPRKAVPGRVVVVWDSLDEEGPWRVLEEMAAIPGAELLLVAPPASASVEGRWRRAANSRRVRRVTEPAQLADAAAEIAASGDVLVYWGVPRCEVARACALREGLASGVPVLVSSDSAPRELAAVTRQAARLEDGLRELLDDPGLCRRLVVAAREHCFELSWHRIAERHLAIWRSLEHP
ncbi:MAG: glycosyltransferase [Chloroflexi bacterium]|nr:glycosyltransferase [Chloroflexota bacterium]